MSEKLANINTPGKPSVYLLEVRKEAYIAREVTLIEPYTLRCVSVTIARPQMRIIHNLSGL